MKRLPKLLLATTITLMLTACNTKTNDEETNSTAVSVPVTETIDDSTESTITVPTATTSNTDDSTNTTEVTQTTQTNTIETTTQESVNSDEDTIVEENSTTVIESNTTTNDSNGTEVVDTTSPAIVLNGAATITLEQNAVYTELGATAVDDVEGNVSVIISGTVDTSTVGSYTVTYSATDSAGNEANVVRVVEVIKPLDTIAPKIKLFGKDNIEIEQDSKYFEEGAMVYDNVDENLTAIISSEVNTSKVGTSVIKYSAIDSSGNKANIERKVIVYSKYRVVIGQIEDGYFDIRLSSKPTSNVTFILKSSDKNKGDIFDVEEIGKSVTFTPKNWNTRKRIYLTGDSEEEYKIITSPIISDDLNYNGLNPDDVSINKIFLKIIKPKTDLLYVPYNEYRIPIKINYYKNNINNIKFKLIKNPDGMVFDKNEIVWTPKTTDEGKSYEIVLEVSDEFGIKDTFRFEVTVAKLSAPMKIVIKNNTITIPSSEECNFDGVIDFKGYHSSTFNITIPDGYEYLLEKFVIQKVESDFYQIRNNIKIQSCVFNIRGLELIPWKDKRYKINIPAYDLGDKDVPFHTVDIYGMGSDGHWYTAYPQTRVDENKTIFVETEGYGFGSTLFFGKIKEELKTKTTISKKKLED